MKTANQYYIHITPKGVEKSRIPWSQLAHHLLLAAQQLFWIVRTDLKAKTFGKSLGHFWLLLEPIILAGLYFFITTVIFPYTGESRQFLSILSALVFWLWFARIVNNSPSVITHNAAIIKQSTLPIHILFFSFLATESFSWLLSFLVLIGFLLCYGTYPSWAYLALPVVILAQISITIALALFCSCAGTLIKDLQGLLHPFVSIWWYLSPGIYSISRVPEKYLPIYQLNPFAHILPAYQKILIDGQCPPLLPLLFITGIFTVVSMFGFKLFNYLKHKFFIYV